MASSLGVDDALLRKLVDVVDVGHTKKGLKPKRKCQKRTEEKKNLLKKSDPGGSTAGPPGSTAAAVVPLHCR